LFPALLWTALERLVAPFTQWDEPPLQPSDENNSVMPLEDETQQLQFSSRVQEEVRKCLPKSSLGALE
jgi:hypothetical protein